MKFEWVPFPTEGWPNLCPTPSHSGHFLAQLLSSCSGFKPLLNLSNKLRRSRAAKLTLSREKPSTSTVELPSWHSEGAGFSGTALGSRPQKHVCFVTFPCVLPARGARLLVAVAASGPGAPVPLSFGSWCFPCFFPVIRATSQGTLNFRLVAAGVTFRRPAGGTSGQTEGHRPKYRLSQVLLYARQPGLLLRGFLPLSLLLCDCVPSRIPPQSRPLPKELDKKVAKFHFTALGVELTVFTQEQAFSRGVKVEVTLKGEHYSYG